MLANVGGVFPTTSPDVVVGSFRARRGVLPVALILFALLFDVSVASNRLEQRIASARDCCPPQSESSLSQGPYLQPFRARQILPSWTGTTA
jgi:hypothetical protein